jgi:two-component system, NarL family, invasion response regulator UvrY
VAVTGVRTNGKDVRAPCRNTGRRHCAAPAATTGWSAAGHITRAWGKFVSESVSAPEGAKPVSVLTVDDQVVFRRVAREVVEATAGFHPAAEAASGEEALELADIVAPDLVLMDVRMPGMDGMEATRRMKRSSPDAVIVLVSVEADALGMHGAEFCGAAGFLLKQTFGPAALRALWQAYGHALPAAAS